VHSFLYCFHVQVKSLCIGHLGEDERDTLLVGTISHVLAYRIEDNADVFYKEVSQVEKLGNKIKIMTLTILDVRRRELYDRCESWLATESDCGGRW
jgi:hypothetical protein